MSKRRTTKKEPELPNMPEPDDLVNKGRKYVECLEEVETAKTAKEEAAASFVAAMREKKKTQLRIDGAIILIKHAEAKDTIKVSKPKEP